MGLFEVKPPLKGGSGEGRISEFADARRKALGGVRSEICRPVKQSEKVNIAD